MNLSWVNGTSRWQVAYNAEMHWGNNAVRRYSAKEYNRKNNEMDFLKSNLYRNDDTSTLNDD